MIKYLFARTKARKKYCNNGKYCDLGPISWTYFKHKEKFLALYRVYELALSYFWQLEAPADPTGLGS